MGIGADIAKKMPPPAELDDVMSDAESPAEDMGEGGEEGEMQAAKESAMEELSNALTSKAPIADKVAAFEAMLEACTPTKGY